jgi:hypothetical protein
MPNVPPEQHFRADIHHPGYPCIEKAGIIWTFMGRSTELPPLLIRQMYLKQVEAVKAGKDPKGVIRKATDDLIVVGGRYGWMSNDEYNQLARASA